jgi:hypothetical protein
MRITGLGRVAVRAGVYVVPGSAVEADVLSCMADRLGVLGIVSQSRKRGSQLLRVFQLCDRLRPPAPRLRPFVTSLAAVLLVVLVLIVVGHGRALGVDGLDCGRNSISLSQSRKHNGSDADM